MWYLVFAAVAAAPECVSVSWASQTPMAKPGNVVLGVRCGCGGAGMRVGLLGESDAYGQAGQCGTWCSLRLRRRRNACRSPGRVRRLWPSRAMWYLVFAAVAAAQECVSVSWASQ